MKKEQELSSMHGDAKLQRENQKLRVENQKLRAKIKILEENAYLRGEDNELGIPKDVWEQVTGADGSIYFHNRDTNETAWEIPNEWEEVLDEEGNTYYHNRSTGETSWDPPMTTNPMRK